MVTAYLLYKCMYSTEQLYSLNLPFILHFHSSFRGQVKFTLKTIPSYSLMITKQLQIVLSLMLLRILE